MSSESPLARMARIEQELDSFSLLPRRQRQRADDGEAGIPSFAAIVDREKLIDIATMLREQGRKAPGLDGIRWEDLSHSDLCSLMRDLSAELKAGGYYPSQARVVRRAKADGGHREITIRSIIHRVVAKAIQLALQPYFELQFLPVAFGSRERRGSWHLLLALEAELTTKDFTVVFQGDIRKAFDNVPVAGVMACYSRHLHDEPLLALIERNLRGTTVEQRTVGIDQGGADSSLALRVLLHENVDLLYDAGKHPPVFSYVDNFYGAASSENMAVEALEHTAGLLLPLGMALKAPTDASVIDLAKGTPATVLGFELFLEGGRLRYGVPAGSYADLRESLLETHQRPIPLRLATAVVQGWLQHLGPVYATPGQAAEVVARARAACQAAGFREMPRGVLDTAVKKSLARWLKVRAKVAEQPAEGIAAPLGTPVEPELVELAACPSASWQSNAAPADNAALQELDVPW